MDCTTHTARLWMVDMLIGTPEDPGLLVLTACQELEPWVKFVLFAWNIPDRSDRAEDGSDRFSPMERNLFWSRLHFTSLLQKPRLATFSPQSYILRSIFRVSSRAIRVFCCNKEGENEL